MRCKFPVNLSGTVVGCGQCMPCRINTKREWTARLLLEYMQYPYSLFVTLTYDDETVPVNEDGEATLDPEDLKRWIHRFRRAHRHIGPVRFFAVGEYGEKTWRPHYHVVLFGVDPTAEKMINETWQMEKTDKHREVRGFTMVGIMNPDRAAYICGYTTKKMTKIGDDRLGRRWPEFTRSSRMGRMGGIGGAAIPWLASTMRNQRGRRALALHGDVWRQVRIGGKVYPLSHYMRRKLREYLDIPSDPYERAEVLGLIDVETGEIRDPVPLPEYYGPWHDTDEYNFALRKRVEAQEMELQLPDTIKKAEKVERRFSRTSPTTRQV